MKKKIREALLTLFFPKRCAVCDCVITGENGICKKCESKIHFLPESTCMICGKKVKEGIVYCYDCSRKKHEFIRNFAVFVYGDIKESLYRFKYNNRAEYGKYYAKAAYIRHGEALRRLGADALVPIPLHKDKERMRGYNQAEEFAKELSVLLEIPVCENLIKRVKKTKPLKTLNVSERQNNLKKAFLFTENDVKLNTVILIDDIYTTGTTLDAVAHICHENGVSRIYALTVAAGAGL